MMLNDAIAGGGIVEEGDIRLATVEAKQMSAFTSSRRSPKLGNAYF
jgi:hypothetical protein